MKALILHILKEYHNLVAIDERQSETRSKIKTGQNQNAFVSQ